MLINDTEELKKELAKADNINNFLSESRIMIYRPCWAIWLETLIDAATLVRYNRRD